MRLPLREYSFYAGLDPGFSGALAVTNAALTTVRVWPMPSRKIEKGHDFDLDGLRSIFQYLSKLPDVAVGVEWPTTRPGEGAERSERFGRGKGYLEAFAYLHNLDYFKISPALWTGRLGLPGKDHANWLPLRRAAYAARFPGRDALITGPRGGVLDGPLDALLIAWFIRDAGIGISGTVKLHGKDSPELLARVLSGNARHRRGMLPRI